LAARRYLLGIHPETAPLLTGMLYAETGSRHTSAAQRNAFIHASTRLVCGFWKIRPLLHSPWEALLLWPLWRRREWSTLPGLLEDACRLPDPDRHACQSGLVVVAALQNAQRMLMDDHDDFAWKR
jgi:hypothetical protein